jgi:tetratricopeptide (TPR) repeat protein
MATPGLIGRYQIRERLGQGGMGVLYLALDPAIDRLVAVKLLRVNQAEIRERFLREARLAARLQHPNIVTVYDVGEHEGQPFIAMEYIPGETFAELIARRASLPLTRKLAMMTEVCGGLAYAHKHGIVHRDVKPANLMVSRDSNLVKILDFGIARGAESTLTQVGMLMGTPNYMSPEQVQGAIVDHRSDIFAVGAVLHELLVYRQAFQAENQAALLNKILTESPEAVTAINTDLDPALAVIVHRALAKRGEDRYPDLKALGGDLTRVMQRIESAQAGHTVQADAHRPPPPSGRRLADPSRLAERRAARIAGHLDSAEAKLAAGDLDGALADAELAAEIDTDDARVVRMHERIRAEIDARDLAQFVDNARALIERGALTEAGAALSQAAALDPDAEVVVECQQALARAREAYEQAQARARSLQAALARARDAFAEGAFDAALRATSEALSLGGDDREARSLQQHIREALDRTIRQAIEAARQDHETGRTGDAIRRLEAFTPRRDEIDAALAQYRQALVDQERAALAAFVAQSLDDAERLLRDERWKDAIDVATRVRARAGERPELSVIVSRAQQGLETSRRRIEAARLTTRAREELRAAHFDQASVLVREALALVPDPQYQEHGDAATLATEIDAAWQADRDRRRREAEAARAEAEARERAAEDARRRAEEEARREREEQARREAEARERLRARQSWLAQQLARARTALDSDHADAAVEVLRAALARVPNEAAVLELLQRAEAQRTIEQQRLAETQRARVSVAWASAQFVRGDQRLALRHLTRVARPHPLVAAALSDLRSGRVPATTVDDDAPLEVDTSITLPEE